MEKDGKNKKLTKSHQSLIFGIGQSQTLTFCLISV